MLKSLFNAALHKQIYPFHCLREKGKIRGHGLMSIKSIINIDSICLLISKREKMQGQWRVYFAFTDADTLVLFAF